jgi:hypothetical protein
MDESGYTGQDLFNTEQSVFALATLNCTEERCQELKKTFFEEVKADELKYSSMKKLVKQQRMILKFMNELSRTPELIKVNLIHKKYMLTGKLVDFVVEPGLKTQGINLYEKGENIIVTNQLYFRLPAIAGQNFFDELLQHFQDMMRQLNRETYDKFFEPISNKFQEQHTNEGGQDQDELKHLLAYIMMSGIYAGYDGIIQELKKLKNLAMIPPNAPLDMGFTASLFLMDKWQRDEQDIITLIYDESSAMANSLHLWNILIDQNNPAQTTSYGANSLVFPIAIGETRLEQSKHWSGLQLVDILAGASAQWAKWSINGKNLNNEYESELDAVIPTFHPMMFFPPEHLTPEGLTLKSEYIMSNSNYIVDLLIARKMEAIRRLQQMGAQFSYRIYLE